MMKILIVGGVFMFCYWIAGTNNEETGLFTISMCLKTVSVTGH